MGFDEIEDVISRVTKFVIADFPNVDFDDVHQDLWIFYLEEQKKGRTLDPALTSTWSALRFQAKRFAWQQRKEHLMLSAQYAYRPSDVRRLLDTFFERASWPEAAVPDDAVSLLGSDGIEMSADLSAAFDRLYYSYKIIIFKKFALKEDLDVKESRYLSTAISRLAAILNDYRPMGRHEGPGRRTVISNDHAAHLVSGDDD